ncbi:aldolase catalytic domain-containing protein [Ruminococcus sp. FC2018]|uniref:aldolase catalytic domain-containing protein n=1 Tax=Ruminococcus sp. FC2018 TaxID=1410617 RepID=UPI00048CE200|nr:aldolase catalytic domain-containing protein [Ruminococcus sp. FC2018]
MNKIQVLDCTLRDGGYCNDWNFGFENAKQIVSGLVTANVEIIECGFISGKEVYDQNSTKFNGLNEVASIIPKNRESKKFVVMMNYGEYDIDNLPNYDSSSVDGIRVAFHKKDLRDALEVCKRIKEKGYLVFVQAMVSLSYSDEEFLSLIRCVNEFDPYAFYIVDSFGMMKKKDLIRLFYMVEHNLNDKICIGFHCHNNMQLAFSNAQSLTMVQTNRRLIIDSSIMGMGRGAGNLNTELFVGYLNENAEKDYFINPLLSIVDKILTPFYERHYWGYSLPNYISASYNAHPNYAAYLDSKKTLTFEEMNDIFGMMDVEKKTSFDKSYIEDLYLKYQAKEHIQVEHLSELRERLAGKRVLMIAPGKSSIFEKEKIISYAYQDDVVVISINYDYDENITDYLFVSNLRRFRDLPAGKRFKSIVTSNIPTVDVFLQVRYKDLLNTVEAVKDNAGLMLAKLLLTLGVKKILIAGMDGYSVNQEENYADQRMNYYTEKELAEKKNNGIVSVLKELGKEIDIELITTPKYVVI